MLFEEKKHFVVLWYQKNYRAVVGYSDADYCRDVGDRYSGYVFMFGSSAISWYSGKQKSIATSTAEAEYIALSHIVKEAIFLHQLYSELSNVDCKSVCIHEDNQTTIAIAKTSRVSF